MILTELYENLLQAQHINGTLLAGGKVYVYYLGRSQLADTWTDIDGESLNTNPIILDAQGMCKCYVDTSYDYTVVVKDRFDQLVFTRDKHVATDGKTQGGASGTIIQGSNNINVDHTVINDKDVYTISGKDYEGVDPIVVDNDLRRISANTVSFGVREPLYFVQDDDQATIIGMSGDVAYTGWVADNFYSASNPSAFMTSGDISGISATITAMIPTALTGDYLTKDSADTLYYGIDNPSAFVTSGDVSAYLVQSDWAQTASTEPDYIKNKPVETTLSAGEGISIVETGNYVVISNTSSGDAEVNALVHSASGTWNSVSSKLDKASADTLYQPLGDYLTTGDSANFYTTANESGFATTDLVSSVSAEVISSLTSADYELVAGSGISIVDDSTAKTTTISVTAQGGNTAVEQLVISSSGTWNTVSSKLDTTAQVVTSLQTETVYDDLDAATYVTGINNLPISAEGDTSVNDLVHTNSANWNAITSISSTVNDISAQIDSAYTFVAGSGISLTDDTANNTTTIAVTAQGTVATSAGIVGDGTTQNPLRADETVLYDGISTGGITFNTEIPLSEAYSNFEYLKIMNGHYRERMVPTYLLSGNQDGCIFVDYMGTGNGTVDLAVLHYSANDTTLIQNNNRVIGITTAAALNVSIKTNNYSTRTFKVIGVNRKQ